MLRNSDKHRLMVRRAVNGRHAVCARGQARDLRRQHTILRLAVQPFEERKLAGVQRRRVRERFELLNDDMRVTDNVALTVDGLRRGEVVRVSVDEVARREVVDGEFDGEVRVRVDGAHILWELELGGGHVVRRGDHTHRCSAYSQRQQLKSKQYNESNSRITRPALNLLPIREREVRHCRAEVDEVVLRRRTGDLSRCGCLLTVLLKAGLHERLVEAERVLQIA